MKNSHRELSDMISLGDEVFNTDIIKHLIDVAREEGVKTDVKNMETIYKALVDNDDLAVRNINSFPAMMKARLINLEQDFWIYRKYKDGIYYPELVVDIKLRSDSMTGQVNGCISTKAYAIDDNYEKNEFKVVEHHYVFTPGEVVRRKLSAILSEKDLYFSTDELRKAHDDRVERFYNVVRNGFAKQFKITGPVHSERSMRRSFSSGSKDCIGNKVIHDVPSDCFSHYVRSDRPTHI